MIRRLFHRHHYTILLPALVHDPVTGGLFPLSKILCRCGAEDPYGHRLRQLIRMEPL